MIDIFSEIQNFVDENKEFALATVIFTWGSAPRLPGSSMAITSDMKIEGSVSGGCVEGAVIEEAMEALKTGKPKKLSFGVSNEEAWSVGLTCGGKLGVFVERFMVFEDDPKEKEVWESLKNSAHNNHACILLSKMTGESGSHLLVYPDGRAIGHKQDNGLIQMALELYKERRNKIIENQGEEYFASIFPKKNRLLVIGAAHISVDLVDLAHQFNFETIVIDPRGLFTKNSRFSIPPDQLYQEWPEEILPELEPDEDTYAVLLTHDPKIDDQALNYLLKSKVAYIGALGSSRTHEKRISRLRKAGFGEEEISQIRGPVGINISAKRPKEIALSILAEIIKVKNR